MILIDGKKIAAKIKKHVKKEIQESGITPGLVGILVGNDPASEIYVALKENACREVGIQFTLKRFSPNAEAILIANFIDETNKNPLVHAILLQLPLPHHLNPDELIAHIDPKKDVDGFHPENRARFAEDKSARKPVLVDAIFEILAETPVMFSKSHVVILANSSLFLEPLIIAFERENSIITGIAPTPDKIPSYTNDATILITALGRPNVINSEHIRENAVIIDIGITKMPDGSIAGDVDADSLSSINGFITPVPGGVGPVTVACLLKATAKLALHT